MNNAAMVHADIVRALNSRDWDQFRSLFHPDYRRESGSGWPEEGAESVIRRARDMVEGLDGEVELWSVVSQGNVSVAEMFARGGAGTVPVPICSTVEVRDGKIIRQRDELLVAS
ncbi:MAG: nuclear transport factor 2 family protein [Dehalococcoidia bacterium]